LHVFAQQLISYFRGTEPVISKKKSYGTISSRLSGIRARAIENLDTTPQVATLYLVLWTLVILCLIRQIISGRYEYAFTCIVALILLAIPRIVERRFSIDIPPLFEAIIYAFIFAAQILGEVDRFYTGFPGWDTILHTINGFLAAAVGFSMAYLLNKSKQPITLSAGYMALMSFCFAMTVGVCWEIIEWIGDSFFGQDMQKDFIVNAFTSVALDPTQSQALVDVSGITSTTIHTINGDVVVEGGYLDIGRLDTMKDLFVNLIGAICFMLFGYFYVKHKGTEGVAANVVESLLVRRTDVEEPAKEPAATKRVTTGSAAEEPAQAHELAEATEASMKSAPR
jgi:uncharacterized membrane protein YjdF